jgi:outer membrane protein OmpA-like peptidoglycan-associated protein
MRKRTYLALGCLLLAGCTTQADGTQSVNKTAVGATVGALAGGVLGNRLDKGNRTRGTIIGAAAGAAAGGGLGYMMDRQEADLREQLASERAQHAVEIQRVRDDLLKLTLANEVSFDVNSATVKPTFKPSLAKVAEVLKSYDSQMTVVGHTDSTGSESYNQQLSERRAAAVRAELIRDGVPAERLSAMGRGENEPRADNSTSAGRAQNRRVEILVQSTA